MIRFRGTRPPIFKLLNQKGAAMRDLFVKRANNNLYNAFFYKGALSHENLSSTWLGSAMRLYNGVEGIGRNIITANNAIWEIIETPLATSFLQESYKAGTAPENIINFYKSSIEGLRSHLGKGLSEEQSSALQEIGLRYGIQNDLMPFKLSIGTPYDAPIGARKINHMINSIKTTDSLTQANQITAGIMYQNMLGNHISKATKWGQLPARIRGMLESGGINAKDWNLLLKSDVLVHDSLFPDMPVEVPSNLLSAQYILNKNKGNKALSVIAEKLQALQHNHVQRSVSSAQFESTAAALGELSVSRNMGSYLVRNAMAFKGYQFDRIARWLAMLDYEGHGYSNQRFAAYASQRMAIGLITGMLRWGLAGRAPQLDSAQDFMDLMMDGAARGDMQPLALAKEFFADFYYTQGNSTIDTLKDKAGSSALGVGTQSLLKNAYNFTSGMNKMVAGDYEKAFYKMRKAFPGSGFAPIDIIFNRLLLDNIFSAIDEDGFYALAKKEMAINSKNTYKYFIEPGKFTPTRGGEISGSTGIEGLRTQAAGEFKEERAQYREAEYQSELKKGVDKEIARKRANIKGAKFKPEHPLYEERRRANKAINAINKKRLQSDDPKVWDRLQARMDKLQAKYDFKVADYYKNNRPETVTVRQAENAYERAKRIAES